MVEQKKLAQKDASFSVSKASNLKPGQQKTEANINVPNQEMTFSTLEKKNEVKVGTDSKQFQELRQVASGYVPSNETLTQNIDTAKKVLDKAKKNQDMSEHGKDVTQSAMDVLDSGEKLLLEKNKDSKLQEMVNLAHLEAQEARQDVYYDKNIKGKSVRQHRMTTGREWAKLFFHFVLFVIKTDELKDILSDSLEFMEILMRRTREKNHPQNIIDSVKEDVTQGNLDIKETKESMKDLRDDFNKGNLTDEQKREKLESKFHQLIMRLSKNPQYRNMMNDLFLIMDKWEERLDAYIKEPLFDPSDNTQKIIDDSKILLSRFGGKNNVNELSEECWNVYKQTLKDDKQALQWIHDFKEWLLDDLLAHPENLEKPESREQQKKTFNHFIDELDNIVNIELYEKQLGKMQKTLKNLFVKMKQDKAVNEFSNNLNKLLKESATNLDGEFDITVLQDTIMQSRKILIPAFIEQMKQLPLPMIEINNEDYYFKFQNITMDASDILPDHVKLFFISGTDIQFYNSFATDSFATIKFEATNIKPKFKDVNFNYKKKKFITMEDEGVADVALDGDGVNIFINWKVLMKEGKPTTFVTDSIKITVDKLNIRLQNVQKHPILDRILLTFLSGSIKQSIVDNIGNNIKSFLDTFNLKLNETFKEGISKKDIQGSLSETKGWLQSGMTQTSALWQEAKDEAKTAVKKSVQKGLGDTVNTAKGLKKRNTEEME